MIGCSKDEVERLLAEGSGKYVAKRPDTVHHSLVFGGSDALRSITKSWLALWCLVAGNEEVRGAAYNDARQFVISSGEGFLKSRTRIDRRPLACEGELKGKFGPIFNLICVKSDTTGKVIGHFTLYNFIGWQVTLAENGGAPDLSIGLISNPLNPGQWSSTIASDVDIRFDWPSDESVADLATSKQRFDALIAFAFEQGMLQEVQAMVNEVSERYGLADGDPMPVAMIDEIAERVALWASSFPYERNLSAAELKALIQRARGT